MPSSSPDDTVRLFLSYAREDFEAVSALYDRLEEVGLRPWMDKRDLSPGQWWRGVIAREVKQSDLVLVCLSPQSVDNRGFFQREIRVALDAWQEKRQDDIYLIPVRLAACEVPQELADFNWVDLDDTNNWKLLLRSIEKAARSLGRPVPVELAAALASGQKRLPQSPVDAPADQVVQLPDPQVTPSVVKVAQGESKGKAEPQVRQWTRGGSWWLLAGLAVVVVAIAIITYVAGLIPSGQPPAPLVPSAGEAGGKETVEAIAGLPTQTPTFTAISASIRGPTDTPSFTQGSDATATITSTPTLTPTPQQYQAQALYNQVGVYAAPTGTEFAAISTLSSGTTLFVCARAGDRYEISLRPCHLDQSLGWVKASNLSPVIPLLPDELRTPLSPTQTRRPAPAATLTPVSTATSEAVILFGDMMTVTSPITMSLVRVPANEFLMGSDPAKDSQAYESEQPQHRVNLSEYYIGKYEVTNAQYAAFVRATGRAVPSHWENARIPAEKENHPVVNVSWNDAIAFTGWLSVTTGLAFRLPTEAEWEKTCRGTEGLIYPWGDSAPDSGKANFNNNVGDTTSVGSYSPKGDSSYGAVDMAGNVCEWTGSLWGRDSEKPDYGYPYDSTDGREDLDAPKDVWRVVRGGSYGSDDGYVRCAYRARYFPNYRYGSLGFRVCAVIQPG